MLMPIEICARDPAGIEMSAPVRRALKRNRIPKVFIRNRPSAHSCVALKDSGNSSPLPSQLAAFSALFASSCGVEQFGHRSHEMRCRWRHRHTSGQDGLVR